MLFRHGVAMLTERLVLHKSDLTIVARNRGKPNRAKPKTPSTPGKNSLNPQIPHLKSLYVEITNRCNSLCTSCVRTYDLAEPERDLPYEQVKALVTRLAPEDSLDRVVLNGVGEATLHPRLVEIVSLFTERGTQVLFNSNAIALSPDMAVALGRAGLQELRISVDGATPATYKHLRGVDVLDRVLRNVKAARQALDEAQLATPKLSIWFTACRSNLREWPAMVRLTHETGVRELYFQRLVFRDELEFGSATRQEALTQGLSERERAALVEARQLAHTLGVELKGSGASDDAERVVDLDSAARPWAGCRRPYESAYVTANGKVLPCCIAPFSTANYASSVLGDVTNTSISDVFRSDAYETFRKEFESEDPRECCKRCGSDWSL